MHAWALVQKLKVKAPTFGKVNAMSMHPLKSLNVMGDGGIVVTNDDKIASWCKKYRNHGMIDRDHIQNWGVNMRLQPLQAVVADIELKKVRKIVKIRNKNASFLDKHLSTLKEVSLPERKKNYTETFALYMARFKKRDQLKSFLIKNGVEVKIHYPIPLHLQKASKNMGYKKEISRSRKSIKRSSNITCSSIPKQKTIKLYN